MKALLKTMREKTVCVVGSGYVGLPLTKAFVMEKTNKSVESALICVLKEFLYMIQMNIPIILGTHPEIMKMSTFYFLERSPFITKAFIINDEDMNKELEIDFWYEVKTDID